MCRQAFVAALLVLVSPVAHADRAQRAKLGDRLVDAGGIILGASYTASFGISAAIGFSCGIESGESLCQHNRFAAGFAPVAGPWVQLGYEHDDASVITLFTVPAVAQLGGLALMIAGGIVELRAR